MDRMAIFIVNYNGLSGLGELFLESLESFSMVAQRFGGVDVWFVDNGSCDGSVEEVRRRFGGVFRYVVFGRNVGYGGACNLAYTYTVRRGLRYTYYVCSNNDIVVHSSGFAELMYWLDKLEKAFPKGFIAGPILVSGYGGGLDTGCYYVDSMGRVWPFSLVANRAEKLARFLMGVPIPVSFVDGAFMVFHRKAIEKARFNPRLFLYNEDVEVCLRAWLHGIPSLLIPVVLGEHYRSSSTSKYGFLSTYLKTRNTIYTMYQYFGAKRLLGGLLHYLWILTENLCLSIAGKPGKERLALSKSILRGILDAISLSHKSKTIINDVKHAHPPLINLSFKTLFPRRLGARFAQDRIKEIVLHHMERWVRRRLMTLHSRDRV